MSLPGGMNTEPPPDAADPQEGIALLERGSVDEAIAVLEGVLLHKPNDLRAHEFLGVAYGMKGAVEPARVHLETAVRINPDDPQYRYNLGELYEQMGRTEDAVRELGFAVQLAPQYAQASKALARLRASAPAKTPPRRWAEQPLTLLTWEQLSRGFRACGLGDRVVAVVLALMGLGGAAALLWCAYSLLTLRANLDPLLGDWWFYFVAGLLALAMGGGWFYVMIAGKVLAPASAGGKTMDPVQGSERQLEQERSEEARQPLTLGRLLTGWAGWVLSLFISIVVGCGLVFVPAVARIAGGVLAVTGFLVAGVGAFTREQRSCVAWGITSFAIGCFLLWAAAHWGR
jgi:tetratricopeptide (TPR) repeat protein